MRKRLLSLADAAWRAPKIFVIVMTGLLAVAASALVFLGAVEDVVRRNGAATLDARRLDWFTDHRWTPLVTAARFLNTAASVAVVAVLAIGVGIWLWRRGLPLALAAVPLGAVVLAETIAAIVKTAIDRARPASSLRLVSETDPSFPSGHATAAMALGISLAVILAVFVLRHRWSRLVALASGLVTPGVVGASRLELGVHWPTDVVAGLALGACIALTVSGLSVWFVNREPGHRSATGRVALVWSRIASILWWQRESGPLLATA